MVMLTRLTIKLYVRIHCLSFLFSSTSLCITGAGFISSLNYQYPNFAFQKCAKICNFFNKRLPCKKYYSFFLYPKKQTFTVQESRENSYLVTSVQQKLDCPAEGLRLETGRTQLTTMTALISGRAKLVNVRYYGLHHNLDPTFSIRYLLWGSIYL
jgi:hypothetical protein